MSNESPASYGGGRLRVDGRSRAAEMDGARVVLTPRAIALRSAVWVAMRRNSPRIANAPMSCGQRRLAPNMSRSSAVRRSIGVLVVATSHRSG
jgi:hypothetical protein